jgi:hypothetical protein
VICSRRSQSSPLTCHASDSNPGGVVERIIKAAGQRLPGAAADPIHYEYTTMASIKGNLLRKLHTQMGQCLDEFEASIAADKAGKGKARDGVLDLNDPNSNNLSTPESEGAEDSRPRRGKSMSEAFPGFDRIRK